MLSCCLRPAPRQQAQLVPPPNFWVVDQQLGQLKHQTLAWYARQLGPAISDFSIFTAIRHPCDRALSTYFFAKQSCRDYNLTWIKSEADVASSHFDPNEYYRFLDCHTTTHTQLSYLTTPGLALPIRLLRQESLAADFAATCQLLGLAPTPELPHLNVNVRKPWQQVLVGDLLARTKAVFRDDFKHFYGS